MKRNDLLDDFYQKVSPKLSKVEEKDEFVKYFKSVFQAGSRKIYQKYLSETKRFEHEWVDVLESYLPSIDKIISDPKTNLRYEEDIVTVEKARKITSRSIRHLAANSHLIKEVRDHDQVVPKKVLTTFTEQDYGTYENRFIMTLINRLHAFINNRYEVIKNNVESFEKNHLNLNSFFEINKAKVHLDIDLVIKDDFKDEKVNMENESLLHRVEHLYTLVSAFKISPFMKTLSEYKPVRPPIQKTNVILKNPDFQNAYNLWLFLDTHNTLWFNVDVEEKDLELDDIYLMDLERLALMVYGVVVNHQRDRRGIYSQTDSIKYHKKSTRIARIHPADVVSNPDSLLMEDYVVVQYYLEKIQAAFEANFSHFLTKNVLPDTALRRALRQTIDVSNALYEAVFHFEEPDTFRRLVKVTDLEEDLAKAKEKARIIKIVRETKEVDYNNTVRLEKKLMKDVEKLTIKLIKAQAQEELRQNRIDLKEAFLREREEERLEAERIQEELANELQRINQERRSILDEQHDINLKIKQTTKKIKEKAEEQWKKEKAQMLEKERLARIALREKEEKKRAEQYAKLRKLVEQTNEEFKKRLIEKRISLKEKDDTISNKI